MGEGGESGSERAKTEWGEREEGQRVWDERRGAESGMREEREKRGRVWE